MRSTRPVGRLSRSSSASTSRPMPSALRKNDIAPPVAIMVFEGMQSHRRAAPPTMSLSMSTTSAPRRAAYVAAWSPAGPPPMITNRTATVPGYRRGRWASVPQSGTSPENRHERGRSWPRSNTRSVVTCRPSHRPVARACRLRPSHPRRSPPCRTWPMTSWRPSPSQTQKLARPSRPSLQHLLLQHPLQPSPRPSRRRAPRHGEDPAGSTAPNDPLRRHRWSDLRGAGADAKGARPDG